MRLALLFDQGHRPGTTGMYFERACQALRIRCDRFPLRDLETLPGGYDAYLRIDHGDDYDVPWPKQCRPALFYAIDTHLPHSWKKIRRNAGLYDLVFCAQQDAARRLPGAEWLPLACDPALHRPAGRLPAAWDVAFVGTDGGSPRKFYLQALRERYLKSAIGAADYTELASIYGAARIGFNYSIAEDLNMRTFEVLASGALLVTNALRGDALLALGLHDRRQLVLYRQPGELFGLIDHFLAHEEERRRIADAGQVVALGRHTYVHRLQELLATASRRLGSAINLTPQEPITCTSS
jgi:hypothetical protein